MCLGAFANGGHLLDFCNTGFNPAYIAPWVSHFNQVGELPIAGHYTQWISDRRNYVVVGGFVLAMAAALTLWITLLTGRTGPTDDYTVVYENVNGLKAGTRIQSAVCKTEVMVIQAPDGDVDVRCGGAAMVGISAEKSGRSVDGAAPRAPRSASATSTRPAIWSCSAPSRVTARWVSATRCSC